MVSLFIPEAEWGPKSWGVNHTLYVRASIENALEESHLVAWGASPSSIPSGGYRVYGVTPLSVDGRDVEASKESVMTPHASFLAMQFAPREALKNVSVLSEQFHCYGPHGFADAVDVKSGRVSETELSLDQGMIMAAIANVLGDGMLQKAFCDASVTGALQQLIEREQFSSGVEPVADTTAPSSVAPSWKTSQLWVDETRANILGEVPVAPQLASFQFSRTRVPARRPLSWKFARVR